nr:l10-interacting myb domain-containing protein [Quercus suber]
MVKQKKSMDSGSKGERADWKDPKELEAFCRFCAVQVMNGQRKATEFLSKIGVNEVIRQLGEMGKVVTWVQIKNKWDNLRKRWKTYNKCMNNETGLGYDAGTGIFDTPDEWWNRKIAACPDAKTFKMYGLPNRDLLNIMFRGTVATGRNAFCTSGPIPTETNEGSGDSADSVEFVDPQCEPVVNVDAMEVEDSLKSISNVLVERSILSAHTPSTPTATAQVKVILDMVLSLPGVYLGHYLHMFSTIYFMEKEQARHMFQAIFDNKDIQLKWLEKEYQRHPEYQ